MSNTARPKLADRQIRQIAENVTVMFTCFLTDGGAADGTGFVVSATEQLSWIMTNRHVITGAILEQSYVYYPPTGQRAKFRILDCPPAGADLAIVETDLKFFEIPQISNRRRLQSNERLFAFGFPGARPAWNTGNYRNRQNEVGRYHPRHVDSKYTEVCDLVSHPGSSGSAVFDVHGDVVGVMSKAMNPQSTPSFMVPIPYVRYMLRNNLLDFVGVGERESETEYVGGSLLSGRRYDGRSDVGRSTARPTETVTRQRQPLQWRDNYEIVFDRQRGPARRRPSRRGTEVELCCAIM
jgi:hypothetical protein